MLVDLELRQRSAIPKDYYAGPRFRIEVRIDGAPVICILSDAAIVEPFVVKGLAFHFSRFGPVCPRFITVGEYVGQFNGFNAFVLEVHDNGELSVRQ